MENNMSIKKQFKTLEANVNTFVNEYLKENILDKEKELKLMFSEPIYTKGLEHDYENDYGLQSAYIKSITCLHYSNSSDKLNIEITATDKYREENDGNTFKCSFNDLTLDDKSMIASDIEDGNFFIVGKDFINNSYEVINDSGYVYNYGDIINTISLARDFLEGCNEKEDADLMGYVYSSLYNNKGEELVKFICEAWDGLELKKIN
jgi:hypothetical protein